MSNFAVRKHWVQAGASTSASFMVVLNILEARFASEHMAKPVCRINEHIHNSVQDLKEFHGPNVASLMTPY